MAKRKPPKKKAIIVPGFTCPNCGGRKWPRLYTRHRPTSGKVIRVRKCKDCGHRFRTSEVIESNSAPGRQSKT